MKRELSILLVFLIMMGCGGKKNNPIPPVLTPAKALLSAPLQNEVCETGVIISSTQSRITFTWQVAANTDSYTLTLTNLITSTVFTETISATQTDIILLRNTPYSWFVTSSSNKTTTTAKSDVWKFYNAGPGVVTYAPFPADLTSPTFGQAVAASSGTVNLTWTGSSVTPGTITNYDIYFGTATSPPKFKSAVTNSFLNNVGVKSDSTYYWKVITNDVNGNTSDSGVSQFSVN